MRGSGSAGSLPPPGRGLAVSGPSRRRVTRAQARQVQPRPLRLGVVVRAQSLRDERHPPVHGRGGPSSSSRRRPDQCSSGPSARHSEDVAERPLGAAEQAEHVRLRPRPLDPAADRVHRRVVVAPGGRDQAADRRAAVLPLDAAQQRPLDPPQLLPRRTPRRRRNRRRPRGAVTNRARPAGRSTSRGTARLLARIKDPAQGVRCQGHLTTSSNPGLARQRRPDALTDRRALRIRRHPLARGRAFSPCRGPYAPPTGGSAVEPTR